jgi:hypothetical protein
MKIRGRTTRVTIVKIQKTSQIKLAMKLPKRNSCG